MILLQKMYTCTSRTHGILAKRHIIFRWIYTRSSRLGIINPFSYEIKFLACELFWLWHYSLSKTQGGFNSLTFFFPFYRTKRHTIFSINKNCFSTVFFWMREMLSKYLKWFSFDIHTHNPYKKCLLAGKNHGAKKKISTHRYTENMEHTKYIMIVEKENWNGDFVMPNYVQYLTSYTTTHKNR